MNSQPARRGARRELLAIQKRLWRRLQREIESSIDEVPANVDIYKEEYQRDLRSYEAVATKRELVDRATQARIVYVGDYHTLPQAQRTLVRLLLAISAQRPEIILCMEMVQTEHQDVLDRYMAGQVDTEQFLKQIEYHKTWDFPWQPYREIFAVARRRGMRVAGINSDPREHEHDHLLERDFRTAKIVGREVEQNPQALVIVFDGDLHIARDHLPFIVDNYLEYERGMAPPPPHVIIHQNAEEIYWRLAKDHKESEINVVRLTADSYCVLNASPIEKLHSYLNWVSERDTLAPPDESSWGLTSDQEWDEDEYFEDSAVDYTEQVYRIVCSVAGFLGIKRSDLHAFSVFTVNDLDFLDYLDEGSFSPKELEDVKRQIGSNESYFIPKGDIIYLADFSIMNAAEEASHFLHHLCSGYSWEGPRTLSVDFYFRIVTEALGFFGSKVIVRDRECWRERDCETYVEGHLKQERERSRRRRAEAKGDAEEPFDPRGTGVLAAASEERVKLLLNHKVTLRASRMVLDHKALEREFQATGVWAGAGAALTQSTEIHLLVTHMLGHMLGDKLYWGVYSGDIEKEIVRKLFHERIEDEGIALARYLELVSLTIDVKHGPSRGERL